jgi:hypothetical protein
MKSRTRTNKASLQAMAIRTALLPVFAVSLITSGFVLSATAPREHVKERHSLCQRLSPPGRETGGLLAAESMGRSAQLHGRHF